MLRTSIAIKPDRNIQPWVQITSLHSRGKIHRVTLSLFHGVSYEDMETNLCERTNLEWNMHHAATIPLVPALAPREDMPNWLNKTKFVSDIIEPTTPEAR